MTTTNTPLAQRDPALFAMLLEAFDEDADYYDADYEPFHSEVDYEFSSAQEYHAIVAELLAHHYDVEMLVSDEDVVKRLAAGKPVAEAFYEDGYWHCFTRDEIVTRYCMQEAPDIVRELLDETEYDAETNTFTHGGRTYDANENGVISIGLDQVSAWSLVCWLLEDDQLKMWIVEHAVEYGHNYQRDVFDKINVRGFDCVDEYMSSKNYR